MMKLWEHVKARMAADRVTTLLYGAAALIFVVTLALVLSHFAQKTRGPRADNPLLAGELSRFYEECVYPVMRQNVVPQSCRTPAVIQDTYKVNIWDVLAEEQARMIATARRIARGELLTDADYNACLSAGACHKVPRIAARDQQNPRRMALPENARKQTLFWHIVNDGRLTPEMCAYMDMCHMAVKAGFLTFPPAAAPL